VPGRAQKDLKRRGGSRRHGRTTARQRPGSSSSFGRTLCRAKRSARAGCQEGHQITGELGKRRQPLRLSQSRVSAAVRVRSPTWGSRTTRSDSSSRSRGSEHAQGVGSVLGLRRGTAHPHRGQGSGRAVPQCNRETQAGGMVGKPGTPGAARGAPGGWRGTVLRQGELGGHSQISQETTDRRPERGEPCGQHRQAAPGWACNC